MRQKHKKAVNFFLLTECTYMISLFNNTANNSVPFHYSIQIQILLLTHLVAKVISLFARNFLKSFRHLCEKRERNFCANIDSDK